MHIDKEKKLGNDNFSTQVTQMSPQFVDGKDTPASEATTATTTKIIWIS